MACSLLKPILNRFWVDFGTENRPKIVPKRVFKSVQNQISFLMPSWTDFWSTWPDLGPQDGPKLGPKWDQHRTKKGIGSDDGSWAYFCAILDRFGDDFGMILGRFLIDFGTIFG